MNIGKKFFKSLNAKINSIELSLNDKALNSVRKELHSFIKDVLINVIEYSPSPKDPDATYSTGRYSRSFAVYAEYSDGKNTIGEPNYSFNINNEYGFEGKQITSTGTLNDIRGYQEVLTALTRVNTLPSAITIYNNARGNNNFPYSPLVEWDYGYSPFSNAIKYALIRHPSFKSTSYSVDSAINWNKQQLMPDDIRVGALTEEEAKVIRAQNAAKRAKREQALKKQKSK